MNLLLLVSLAFLDLLTVIFALQFDLLNFFMLNCLFLVKQVLVVVLCLNFLGFNVVLDFMNTLFLPHAFGSCFKFGDFFMSLDFLASKSYFRLDLVQDGSLNQHFPRVLDHGQIFVLAFRVFVLDVEHAEGTVGGDREESAVVVADTHARDRQGVRLHLVGLLEGVTEHLDGARLLGLIKTNENCLALVH